MSRYVYTQEKLAKFKMYWPKAKSSIPRIAFSNRKQYVKELQHQRYLLWRQIDLELGIAKRPLIGGRVSTQ